VYLIVSVRGVVRDALVAVLAETGADVAAPANLHDVERALRARPDAVLVAAAVPPVDGSWAAGRRVLALDGLADADRAELRDAGADVVLPASRSLAAVVAAAIAPGPVAATAALVAFDEPDRRAPHRVLTPRELQVICLIGRGLTGVEIAETLGVRPKTVENHKQRLFAKLDVQNQAHAVSRCMRLGLLDEGLPTTIAS
jgi:DNA-binding NarL/FixJ family response regulator